MAKKSAIEKNKSRGKLVQRDAGKRARLKAIACDKDLPLEEQFKARLKLSELPRNGAKIRLRNRCEISGRPRGLFFGMFEQFIMMSPFVFSRSPKSGVARAVTTASSRCPVLPCVISARLARSRAWLSLAGKRGV